MEAPNTPYRELGVNSAFISPYRRTRGLSLHLPHLSIKGTRRRRVSEAGRSRNLFNPVDFHPFFTGEETIGSCASLISLESLGGREVIR